MSGAEVAGLALGAVALASLFNSCIELLEIFELGKNYLYDYDTACTKVSLLRERLSDWGKSTHIQERGQEHPSLREPVRNDIVSKSLGKLREIISDTQGLQRKYDLRPAKSAPRSVKDKSKSHRIVHWPSRLRQRTTWSIRDRAKFDRFIDDISFLIDNLEKVTSREIPSEMTSQSASTQRDLNSPGDLQSTPGISNSGPHSQPSLVPRDQPAGVVARRSQDSPPMGSTFPPSGASDTAGGTTGRTMPNASIGGAHSPSGAYTESNNNSQQNMDSLWAFQGALYEQNGVHIVRNLTQINKGGAGGYQGAAYSEAALKMQQQANEHYTRYTSR
jgi:hypothetical protein